MANRPRPPRIPAPPVPAATGSAQAKLPVSHLQSDRSTATHVRQANSAVQAKLSQVLPQVPPHVQQALTNRVQTPSPAAPLKSRVMPVAISQAKPFPQDRASHAAHVQQAVISVQARHSGESPQGPPRAQTAQAPLTTASPQGLARINVIAQAKQLPQPPQSHAAHVQQAIGAAQVKNSGNLKAAPDVQQAQSRITQAKLQPVSAQSHATLGAVAQARPSELKSFSQTSTPSNIPRVYVVRPSQPSSCRSGCQGGGETVQASFLEYFRVALGALQHVWMPSGPRDRIGATAPNELYTHLELNALPAEAEKKKASGKKKNKKDDKIEQYDKALAKKKSLENRIAAREQYLSQLRDLGDENQGPVLGINQELIGSSDLRQRGTEERYNNREGFLPAGRRYSEYHINRAGEVSNDKRLIVSEEDRWFTARGTHEVGIWMYWDNNARRWKRWNITTHQAQDLLVEVPDIEEGEKLTGDQVSRLTQGVWQENQNVGFYVRLPIRLEDIDRRLR